MGRQWMWALGVCLYCSPEGTLAAPALEGDPSSKLNCVPNCVVYREGSVTTCKVDFLACTTAGLAIPMTCRKPLYSYPDFCNGDLVHPSSQAPEVTISHLTDACQYVGNGNWMCAVSASDLSETPMGSNVGNDKAEECSMAKITSLMNSTCTQGMHSAANGGLTMSSLLWLVFGVLATWFSIMSALVVKFRHVKNKSSKVRIDGPAPPCYQETADPASQDHAEAAGNNQGGSCQGLPPAYQDISGSPGVATGPSSSDHVSSLNSNQTPSCSPASGPGQATAFSRDC